MAFRIERPSVSPWLARQREDFFYRLRQLNGREILHRIQIVLARFIYHENQAIFLRIRLPQSRDTVGVQCSISTHNGYLLDHCLANQQTVKGVTVMETYAYPATTSWHVLVEVSQGHIEIICHFALCQ
jgi:hypothetical protein